MKYNSNSKIKLSRFLSCNGYWKQVWTLWSRVSYFCPKKYGFGQKFVFWINTPLKYQDFCVFNGGKTTKYFWLERGARQDDPISTYLFILVLKILFRHLKTNSYVKAQEVFEHYSFSAYGDDINFLWKTCNQLEI